jgi:hypothetical protein
MPALTKDERDELLQRAWELDARLYPPDRSTAPKGRAAAEIRELYYRVLAEYVDRLPRVPMSVCPFSGAPLLHSFDPFGLDGPWWQQDREVEIEEPAPPPTFKVLLGAVALHGREPAEARDPVIPGPEAPYVVPRLLRLPGMVAVVSELRLETGDTAYPIAYFSESPIAPRLLHQHWLQQDLWFEVAPGKSGWLIANDVWDFELEPWLASGKLRWAETVEQGLQLVDPASGPACRFVGLEGARWPQSIAGGQREFTEPPDGTPINPYED